MNRRTKIVIGIIAGVFIIGCGVAGYCYVNQKNIEVAEREAKEKLQEEKDTIRTIYTEDYQNEVEQELETKKNSDEYTEDHMLIEQNPYGTNTLSLYVYFNSENAVKVSYTVSVEEEEIDDFSATPAGENSYQTEHEFQVIGLIPEQKNTVTFTLQSEDGAEQTYQYECEIGALQGQEEVKLEKTEENIKAQELSNGLYVILGNDSDDLDFMYYYDNQGVIRGEIPIIGYRSHRLLFQNNLMYYSISESKIAAVNTLGKVEHIYRIGTYKLHHDYVFDDDGNILVLATDSESESVEDRIIRINTQTGEVTEVLDLGNLFADYKDICTENSDGELDWMHINTIQWLGEETVLLSSRETSSILKITNIYSEPKVEYMIGESSFWQGTEYEELLLSKDEANGTFSGTGGQHSITYIKDDTMADGEYELYMFNNNMGVSWSREDYDWTQIDGIETSMTEGTTSYFYKYKVDENTGTYSLVQSFAVPFSAYVSSAQVVSGNIIIDSGMKGIFGEYDSEGNMIIQFKMKLADEYIYRVYKYDFVGFYFAE